MVVGRYSPSLSATRSRWPDLTTPVSMMLDRSPVRSLRRLQVHGSTSYPSTPAVGPLLLRAERLRQQLVGPDLVGRQQRAVRDALQPLVVREVGERLQLAGHRHGSSGGRTDRYRRSRSVPAGAGR